MSPLSTVWHHFGPSPDVAGVLARALRDGATVGESLAQHAPQLARVAVRRAARRFDDGPLALFIVDVRDALRRLLLEASAQVADVPVRTALRRAAGQVTGDTFVQHLINTLLEAHGAYSEAVVVKGVARVASAKALTALFERSLCVLVTRADAGRRCGERSRRLEFIALPSPSSPRA